MRISTLKDEKSVPDLVARLFEIKGPDAEARAEQAAAALLEANPHLADLKTAPPGVPIIVPEVEGIKQAEEVHPAATALKNRFDEIRPALGKALKALDASATSRATEAKNNLRALKLARLKTLAKNDPEVGARLPVLLKDAEAKAKEAEAFKKIQNDAFGQLEKNLGELGDLFGHALAGLSFAPPATENRAAEDTAAPPPAAEAAAPATKKASAKKAATKGGSAVKKPRKK